MTNDQINRAVAEELRWKPVKHPHMPEWTLRDNDGNAVGVHGYKVKPLLTKRQIH